MILYSLTWGTHNGKTVRAAIFNPLSANNWIQHQLSSGEKITRIKVFVLEAFCVCKREGKSNFQGYITVEDNFSFFKLIDWRHRAEEQKSNAQQFCFRIYLQGTNRSYCYCTIFDWYSPLSDKQCYFLLSKSTSLAAKLNTTLVMSIKKYLSPFQL